MSILIKGMKMPGGCIKCPFLRWVDYDCMAATELKENGFCNVRSKLNIKRTLDYIDTRHPKCPLVEVPTPHGQLIDADDVKSRMIPLDFSVQKCISEVEVSNCKSIIEAEE